MHDHALAALIAQVPRPDVPPLAKHPIHDRTEYVLKNEAIFCLNIHMLGKDFFAIFGKNPEDSRKEVVTGWEIKRCRYFFLRDDAPEPYVLGVSSMDMCVIDVGPEGPRVNRVNFCIRRLAP